MITRSQKSKFKSTPNQNHQIPKKSKSTLKSCIVLLQDIIKTIPKKKQTKPNQTLSQPVKSFLVISL